MAVISRLKAVLSLDNKQFKAGLDDSKKQTDLFGASIKKMGGIIAAAFSAKVIFDFVVELERLNKTGENVTKTFAKLGITLKSLRDATGGGIGDLRLQQMAIQAVNLGVNVENLANYFKFASLRAAETGESVDYLVNSIVIGVGRQSRLVLDNLGIGLAELNREIEKTGDFASAANNIIQRELTESNIEIENAVSGIERMSTAWGNIVLEVSQSDLGEDIGKISRAIGSVAEAMALAARESNEEGGWLDWVLEGKILKLAEFYIALERAAAAYKAAGQLPDWLKTDEDLGEFAGMPAVSSAAAPVTDTDIGGIDYESMSDLLTQFNQEHKYFTDSVIAQNAAMMESFEFADEGYIADGLNEIITQYEAMSQAAAQAQLMTDQLNESLSNMAAQGIAMAAHALGEMIGGNTEDALANFIGGIASLLEGFGALLISFGVSLAVLQESMNPYAMIAAGAALIVIGAVMGSQLGKVSSAAGGSGSSASGGGSYSGGTYGGGGYDMNREVVLVARGEDLVAVINRQNYRDGTNG